jgi:rubredoxin
LTAYRSQLTAYPSYQFLLTVEYFLPGKEIQMRKWECIVCGFIYDEAKGLPEDGIAAGTRWEDIPADWACPECGIAKADFEMVLMAA